VLVGNTSQLRDRLPRSGSGASAPTIAGRSRVIAPIVVLLSVAFAGRLLNHGDPRADVAFWSATIGSVASYA
jgi:hypothetical protein